VDASSSTLRPVTTSFLAALKGSTPSQRHSDEEGGGRPFIIVVYKAIRLNQAEREGFCGGNTKREKTEERGTLTLKTIGREAEDLADDDGECVCICVRVWRDRRPFSGLIHGKGESVCAPKDTSNVDDAYLDESHALSTTRPPSAQSRSRPSRPGPG